MLGGFPQGGAAELSEEAGGERLTGTPAGVTLGPLDIVVDGGARNFVLEVGGRHFHGFVVRQGTNVFGYVDRCPHMNVPLARELDAYMAPLPDLIMCGWHDALFRVRDGLCVSGPCSGARLKPWAVTVAAGMIKTC